jgi:hypothetical protein
LVLTSVVSSLDSADDGETEVRSPVQPELGTLAQNERYQRPRDQNATTRKEEARGEPYNTGWSIYLDNDLIAVGSQDDRYTGGLAVSLSGRRAAEYLFSLDPVLGALNDLTGYSRLGGVGARTRHSIEFGGTAFTPEDVEATEPLPDQQPYASLLFMNNTRKTISKERDVAYLSTLSVGVLGLDAVGEVQKALHDLTGSDEVKGWDNQISDGGEPTFFYSLVRQDLLAHDRSGRFDYDVRSLLGGSAGAITQAGAGLDVRFGRISSSPWRFNANYVEFVNLGMPVAEQEEPGREQVNDLYGWASVQGRVRGYNALLEGQFRDSPVTFDRGELRTLVGSAAVGVTAEVYDGTRITVSLRGRTTEIRDAEEPFPMWGALIFSRSY